MIRLSDFPQPAIPAPRRDRNAALAVLIMLGGAVVYGGYIGYLAARSGAWQLGVAAAAVGVLGGLTLPALGLIRRGRLEAGMVLTGAGFLAADVVIAAFVRGLGPSFLVICPLITGLLVTRVLSRRDTGRAVAAAVLVGAACLLLDLMLPGDFRLAEPSLRLFTPAVAGVLAAVYAVVLLRLIADYSLRAKLIIAFVLVALVPLALLAIVNYRAQVQSTALLAVVVVALAAGAALAASHVLSRPLARLTRVAEQVAGGDLAARAEVTSRDEIGTLAAAFNTMAGRVAELVSTLEQRVGERTAQLQAAAEISRATASVRDMDELLRLALDLIRDRFGYYHASIFLLDESGRSAVLREATGEVGTRLKVRGHRLAVGSRSLIGWVTANRQPRVARDVGEDPFHFKNPLLPDTHSELAIPLVSGRRVLGALDVQSQQADAFGPDDVQVLQTVADQLSIAIENAELFERTQANLRELGNLYQRLTGASWRSLLRGQVTEKAYETSGVADVDLSAEVFEVPLVLRDQVLGVIEIHGRPAEAWSAEERGALSTIAAQIASALESAALLEETQRRRQQEQLINDITHQMRATLDPAGVVQSGIRELGRALGATEVVVKLAPGGAAPTPPAPDLGSQPEGEP